MERSSSNSYEEAVDDILEWARFESANLWRLGDALVRGGWRPYIDGNAKLIESLRADAQAKMDHEGLDPALPGLQSLTDCAKAAYAMPDKTQRRDLAIGVVCEAQIAINLGHWDKSLLELLAEARRRHPTGKATRNGVKAVVSKRPPRPTRVQIVRSEARRLRALPAAEGLKVMNETLRAPHYRKEMANKPDLSADIEQVVSESRQAGRARQRPQPQPAPTPSPPSSTPEPHQSEGQRQAQRAKQEAERQTNWSVDEELRKLEAKNAESVVYQRAFVTKVAKQVERWATREEAILPHVNEGMADHIATIWPALSASERGWYVKAMTRLRDTAARLQAATEYCLSAPESPAKHPEPPPVEVVIHLTDQFDAMADDDD